MIHCNIICPPLKVMHFCKIWRAWVKNWACHAHFNFDLPKGMAVLSIELEPSIFGEQIAEIMCKQSCFYS